MALTNCHGRRFQNRTRGSYIIEYSTDGVNYLTGAQAVAGKGNYTVKHHTLETRPLLYRIRVERTDNRFSYSEPFLLPGAGIDPVRIFPTVITGDVINLNAGFPVERANITAADGRQVFVKELGGISGFTTIAIPPLGKGYYWITFFGNGWKSTTKFMVEG